MQKNNCVILLLIRITVHTFNFFNRFVANFSKFILAQLEPACVLHAWHYIIIITLYSYKYIRCARNIYVYATRCRYNNTVVRFPYSPSKCHMSPTKSYVITLYDCHPRGFETRLWFIVDCGRLCCIITERAVHYWLRNNSINNREEASSLCVIFNYAVEWRRCG